MKRQTIVPRAEIVLLCVLGIGFLLVLQTWAFPLYRVGIIIIMGATLLNIAVGNLSRDAGPWRALLMTVVLLAVVAVVFAIGILLVPTLSQMGQSS
ncbi:hypothetical protein [Acidisoma cladoniae]|jgi:predicted PurR-regulated permease PerM|uniref:hypothetical protein n=1 Tax=Acidisoma cladoniae TaxID=3040935 RepID=UPI002550026D|nr:hypothetical protein [Acidisoma sp. PAMC 29798]